MRAHRKVLIALLFGVLIAQQAPGDTAPLDDRSRCIALFKEVLAYARCQDVEALFAKIADQRGDDRFVLTPELERIKLSEQLNDVDKRRAYFDKQFSCYGGILEHFDGIRASELRTERRIRISIIGSEQPEEAGELLVMDVALPKATGVD